MAQIRLRRQQPARTTLHKQEAFDPDKVAQGQGMATDKVEQTAASPDKGAGRPPPASEGCQARIIVSSHIFDLIRSL